MNEFIAGGMSGFTQIIVGYPLDTIKVRLQNNNNKIMLKPNEYYQGVQYPLLCNVITNSILFYTCNSLKTSLRENNEFNIPNYAISPLSGFISGLTVSPIIYFFEIGKSNNQMGTKIKMDMNTITSKKGLITTMWRESIAFATYFGTYDYLRTKDVNILLSGSISGLTNWTITYPIDVIRNRQIVLGCSALHALKQGGLWKGYSFCAIRSIMVNSVGFATYEYFKNISL